MVIDVSALQPHGRYLESDLNELRHISRRGKVKDNVSSSLAFALVFLALRGLPGGAGGKNSLTRQERQEMQVRSLDYLKMPWRRTWQSTLVFWPGNSIDRAWQAGPLGCNLTTVQ